VNIAAAFQTAIMTPVLAALSDLYTQDRNTVRFFDDALDPPISFTETGVGAITGEREADYVSVCVQLKTGVRGRQYRGSKKYGPIGELQVDGDLLVAGSVTLFEAVGEAIVAGFTDSDGNIWASVIKSSKPPAQYRDNPTYVIATQVTSYLLNKTTGTMRRRKARTVN
jgi:hypothetical protein